MGENANDHHRDDDGDDDHHGGDGDGDGGDSDELQNFIWDFLVDAFWSLLAWSKIDMNPK